MTDLSEIVESVFTDGSLISKLVRPFVVNGTNGGSAALEKQFPGIRHHRNQCVIRRDQAVGKGVRYFAGRVFKNGQQAVDETSAVIQHDIEAALMRSVAKGMLVGQMFDELQAMTPNQIELWMDNTEIVDEELKQALELVEDRSSRLAILSRFAEIFTDFLDNSGLAMAEGENTSHIWEAWKVVLGASLLGYYGFGIEIGKRCAEKKVFEEIVASVAQ